MEQKTIKNCFRPGPIKGEFIGESITKHQSKTSIGAHQIFLGQVRADIIEKNKVIAIEYSAHESIANRIFHEIREKAFNLFKLECMHIYHSIGTVSVGEICLFVFVSSKHRKEAICAIDYIVEEIKANVPIFGKEVFENNEHVWKVNK